MNRIYRAMVLAGCAIAVLLAPTLAPSADLSP